MKKIILIALGVLLVSSLGIAQTGFGFFMGLATPNDKINDVYYSRSDIKSYWTEGSKSGYTIGAKYRMALSNNFAFTMNASWCRFPESSTKFSAGPASTDTVIINTTTNLFPIDAGVNFYLINSAIKLYGTGDISYNFISSTVDYQKNDVSIPLNLDKSPMDTRVGAGLGAGVDLDVKLFQINLEGKYNIANLIGKQANEKTKAYFTLTLGILF